MNADREGLVVAGPGRGMNLKRVHSHCKLVNGQHGPGPVSGLNYLSNLSMASSGAIVLTWGHFKKKKDGDKKMAY